MRHETIKPVELSAEVEEIREIEATELELREDLLGSLFSCCCPCGPTMIPYDEN